MALVHDPQPAAAALLALLLPGVAVAGVVAARAATLDRGLAAILGPGVAIAVWLLAVHVASLALGSFTTGIWFGSAFAAAGAAVVVTRVLRRRELRRSDFDPGLSRAGWITAVLTTIAVMPAAFGWAFHDEHFVTGHLAIVAKIQNGPYPPHHGVFPTSLLRYHYGFDLLVAVFATVFRLRADHAIDTATLGLWFYSWCLLWALGERLVGRSAGVFSAATVLLGGGIAMFAPAAPRVERLLGWVEIDHARVNQPWASHFFQHPWALGLPIALCALAIGLDRAPRRGAGRVVLLIVLLLVLSLSQVVLFGLVIAGLLVAELRMRGQRSPRRALVAVALAAGVVMTARCLGGFFAPQPTDPGALLRFDAHGITPRFGTQLLWNIVGLGLLLPLGIAGLRSLGPAARWALGTIAVSGLLATNLLAYPHSWDIVKFSTASAVALGLAASAVLWKLILGKPTVRNRTLGLSLFALTVLPGVAFLSVFALRMPGVPRPFIHAPAAVSADDAQAIDWLRRQMGPRDIAYRNLGASAAYAQWGGIAQPYVDSATPGFGFPAMMIERRNALLARLPGNADAYAAEGIRWFVLDETDTELRAHVREWQRQGRCESVAHFGAVEIFALR